MAAENSNNLAGVAPPQDPLTVVAKENESIIPSPKNNDSSVKMRKRGGWKLANLILVNQGFVTLAFFGVGVNLVLFLTGILGQENSGAANNVSKWMGTVYLCSLLGALLSDSYLGCYLTAAIFQLIFLIALALISLSSFLLTVSHTSLHINLFYFSIYLLALGYGGYQPTIATLGSDQFEDTVEGEVSRDAFFGYFYLALNLGCLFSNTILVYFENSGMWTAGFLASFGSAAVGLILFLLGSKRYRFVKPSGNPLTRVAQVLVAAVRKQKVQPPASPEDLYETDDPSIKGRRKIFHSTSFKFLDRAATIAPKDLAAGYPPAPANPWRLCTVTQVEEAKAVMKLLPIWFCTIMYSVIFTQMQSLFVEQGNAMDTRLGKNFHIPAASMSAFDILTVMICTAVYSYINEKGFAPPALRRMGLGLIVGMFSMIAAGLTEIERLKFAKYDFISGGHSKPSSNLTIMWQIPQYVLIGMSEVLVYVGQLEFFNGQAPDGMKSLGSSMCMASMSVGNFVSSLLVKIVTKITVRRGSAGWIPEDLNVGRLDYFFFLIAVMTAVDLVGYVAFGKWYKPINVEGSSRGQRTDEAVRIDEV